MCAVRRCAVAWVLLASLGWSGCVNVDPETGDTIPRGNQRHYYSHVTEQAKKLQKGMSKLQVTLLLGSAAEQSASGDSWVYLPERPAVLLPASALKLEFGPSGLENWGYHAIVLGARL